MAAAEGGGGEGVGAGAGAGAGAGVWAGEARDGESLGWECMRAAEEAVAAWCGGTGAGDVAPVGW